jgi:hypothetical protein
MSNVRLSGQVMVRPVRIGLLARADADELVRGVEWATSSWGGLYTPMFDPGDRDQALRGAAALEVDALYPVGDEHAAEQIASTPGYQWIDRPPFGPYAESSEYRSSHLLTADMFLGAAGRDHGLVRHRWASTDPLHLLFTAWFGAYGSSNFDRRIESQFSSLASEVAIDPDAEIPPLVGQTPLSLTTTHIEYTGESTFHGFILMNPADPGDLLRFWNARAYGGRVFPWPITYSRRLQGAAAAWLAGLRSDGILNCWRRGDGTLLPPRASVLLRDTDTAIPDDLLELLADAKVESMPEHELHVIGWTGSHPFRTEFSRTFSIDVGPSEWQPAVPLPSLPIETTRLTEAREMLVAAQIWLSTENDPSTTRWATLPNVRSLAKLLARRPLFSPLHRPASAGRVIAVKAEDTDCKLELVPTHEAAAALFESSQWSFTQSDNGIFATRVGTMLGGPDASAPLEPAMRAVLCKVVRSSRGKRFQELEAIARSNKGSWPGTFSLGQTTSEYTRGVPLRLLHQKLLRPQLSLRCPECTIPTTMKPEEIETEVTCPMCSAHYPLGFALAKSASQPSWTYRTPSDIDKDQLLETIALLATRAALRSWHSAGLATPHLFGAKLNAVDQDSRRRPGDQSCELDLLFFNDDRGQPTAIVGEIKHKGRLEETDLRNLQATQQWFASREIDCWVLFATLRRGLDASERNLLRAACEAAPRIRGSRIAPIFPIILLRPELSAPWMDDDSISKWCSSRANEDLGIASCERNLGLERFAPSFTAASGWTCHWTESTPITQSA